MSSWPPAPITRSWPTETVASLRATIRLRSAWAGAPHANSGPRGASAPDICIISRTLVYPRPARRTSSSATPRVKLCPFPNTGGGSRLGPGQRNTDGGTHDQPGRPARTARRSLGCGAPGSVDGRWLEPASARLSRAPCGYVTLDGGWRAGPIASRCDRRDSPDVAPASLSAVAPDRRNQRLTKTSRGPRGRGTGIGNADRPPTGPVGLRPRSAWPWSCSNVRARRVPLRSGCQDRRSR